MSFASHHSKAGGLRPKGAHAAAARDRAERAAVEALVRRLNGASAIGAGADAAGAASADGAAFDELAQPDAANVDPAAVAPGLGGAAGPALTPGAADSDDVSQLLQECRDLLRQIADNTARATALTAP